MLRRLALLVILIALALTAPALVNAGMRSAAGTPTVTPKPTKTPKPPTPTRTPTITPSPVPPTLTPTINPISDSATPIKHIVIIVQENRSFFQYFSTFPGVDGGLVNPPPCLPNRVNVPPCISPFHNPMDSDSGANHTDTQATADINNGAMDGFVLQATKCLAGANNTHCVNGASVAMGYKDGSDLPAYWGYASNYVLQDHMFPSTIGWSLPAHLNIVSAYSAFCATPIAGGPADPMACVPSLYPGGALDPVPGYDYAWTDITNELYLHNVSWGWYLREGFQPDCADDEMECTPGPQQLKVPSHWNVLPQFDTVKLNAQLSNIQTTDKFLTAVDAGTLPAVSWVIPDSVVSEHPPNTVSAGQTYVENLITHLENGPEWSSTAIFLTWDDWGGYYDPMVPPVVDGQQLGIRVPGLLISPWAKVGYIDHQTLTTDSYLRFVEDNFLNGQRLDPATDGRPDSRPHVMEDQAALGDLMNEFDFTAIRAQPFYQYYPPTP